MDQCLCCGVPMEFLQRLLLGNQHCQMLNFGQRLYRPVLKADTPDLSIQFRKASDLH